MLRSHFLPKLIFQGVKNANFLGFCSNLRNMDMILEILGMTTGEKSKDRGGKTKGRGWGWGYPSGP